MTFGQHLPGPVLPPDSGRSRPLSVHCVPSQPASLGMLRSDYFACDLQGTISQVETNTIAAGWSAMSQVTDDMHR